MGVQAGPVSRVRDAKKTNQSLGEGTMTDEEIIQWMRDKVKRDGFTDAASLAEDFLRTHSINTSLDPTFAKTLDAGFKIAQEIHGF